MDQGKPVYRNFPTEINLLIKNRSHCLEGEKIDL